MKIKRAGLVIGLIILAIGATAGAQAVVHGFKAEGTILPGWIVALNKADSSAVEIAPADDPERMYGVVIDPNDAPLTVQKEDQDVFVATSGNYPVLASTENGPIVPGDYLSMSSTNGIAAKADSNERFIIGRALSGFSGGTNTILRKDGSAIGYTRVQVASGKNPLLKEAAGIPGPLREVGESIAGKPVSALRMYSALGVFLITALIAGIMLWGGIRNALVAIGRNPLSRHAIIRGLTQVILAAGTVLIIGLLGVYLLLKI